MLKDLEERINMSKHLENIYKQLGNLNRYKNSKREPNDDTKIKNPQFQSWKTPLTGLSVHLKPINSLSKLK